MATLSTVATRGAFPGVQGNARREQTAAARMSGERGADRPQGASAGAVLSRGEPRGLEGLRLTRRGRIVVWVLALLVAAAGVFGGVRAFASEPAMPTRTETVTVMPGQSLWEFARGVVRPGEDIRDAVDRIMAINGLVTADLQIGQRLDLPVDE